MTKSDSCEAHLNTSPFNIMADNCAGDRSMNLVNEKKLLEEAEKQNISLVIQNQFTNGSFPGKKKVFLPGDWCSPNKER